MQSYYDVTEVPTASKRKRGSTKPPRKRGRIETSHKKSSDDMESFFSRFYGTENKPPDSDSDSESEEEPNEKPNVEELEKKVEELKKAGVKDVDDLILLGQSYHPRHNPRFYDLDLSLLHQLVEPLTSLRNLVGMHKVKQDIVSQIVFFVQELNKGDDHKKQDMLHTVITGPPGVGKTELGKILGRVYAKMGILKKGHMRVVKRADMIGKYLGHTAPKTQAAIDSCRGGVMFIDEAYALGNPEQRDLFAKECLDTLNQNLSERRDFLCIIAGYKDSLDQCFFAYNPGLRRRFSFHYDIEGYSAHELRDIFLLKVQQRNWTMNADDMEALSSFFVRNYRYFPRFGGDMETLFLKAQIFHGRRVMLLEKAHRKILTVDDMEGGFKLFVSARRYDEELPDNTDGASKSGSQMMIYHNK